MAAARRTDMSTYSPSDPALTRVAFRRRLLLLVLILVPSFVASQFMIEVLPKGGSTYLELIILVAFSTLFGWISIGLWVSVFGFFSLLRGVDRYAITRDLSESDLSLVRQTRTAVIMPIYGENVARVSAGLRVTYESLARTSYLEHFDFHILSDTTDPGLWVHEEAAWAQLCQDVNGFGRIFYRRRRINIKRKSGNVADFCRRWGKHYDCMVVFDADSIMSGEALVKLTTLMQKHPHVGMIQTLPKAVNQRTLFARIQQFASHFYGPMFAAGLHWWQLGDGQYWGHNAIIRIDPFVKHCALPRLPGNPPLGGDILSHDFVESALLRRAGWGVWLAYDLAGSYEETPPSLLDELKRDRRWCQGNLQHMRLLFADGLFPAHRALFMNGIMSYASALIWFVFLGLSTVEAIQIVMTPPDYFPSGQSLFPRWPVWHPAWALMLTGVTAAILFLPKILCIVLVIWRGRTQAFGGIFRLILSVLSEIVVSTLFAPIRALFHSKFVIYTLLGQNVAWGGQNRGEDEISWGDALRYHGGGTVFASFWGLAVFYLNPGYFWWLTPIVGALVFAVPSSVLAARSSVGLWAARRGLFLTPEEIQPSRELTDFSRYYEIYENTRHKLPAACKEGFVRAVVDPQINALHLALLGLSRGRQMSEARWNSRMALISTALTDGPAKLNRRERSVLLSSPRALAELHQRVWLAPSEQAGRWGICV